MNSFFKSVALAFIAALCFGCAGAPKKAGADRTGAGAPQWVNDTGAAYPETEWLSAVREGPTRENAASNASNALAAIFKVDVKSVTEAMESMSAQTAGGKTAYAKKMGLQAQIETTVDVAGLMGLMHDFWTAPDGKVWSCARMNIKNGTATYTTLIKENANNIDTLIADAAAKKGSFEAYQSLGFAHNIAVVNDNYMNLLSVLNPAARSALKNSYGNAAAVRALMQNAANAAVVNVAVTGDVNGRIAKAFSDVFTSRKFKTGGAAAATYTLNVTFLQENVDLPQNPNKFVRYEITAALTDKSGKDAVNFSDTYRSGHSSITEARQRSLRDAERKITNATEEPTGFAAMFDEYLASLLK